MQRGEAVATAGLGEMDPGRQAISEGEAASDSPLSRPAALRDEGTADAGSWRRGGAPTLPPCHLEDLPCLDTSIATLPSPGGSPRLDTS